MLRVNTNPRKRNAPRIAEKHCPGFLQWLRGRECLFVSLGDCAGKIEAMHLDFAGDKGMATKVSDKYAAPSCSEHHRAQHFEGWDSFLRSVGLTKPQMLAIAEQLWRAWPGRAAWERKLSDAS